MSGSNVVELTALYVPGNRPERFDKAVASGADVVIVDLEDAVLPAEKDHARGMVAQWLPEAPAGRISVRVNAIDTPWAAADLETLRDLADRGVQLHSVRVPKIDGAAAVATVRRSLQPAVPPVAAIIESALGVERLFEIATADGLSSVSLGEADLRSDLGAGDDEGLLWSRGRMIVAARAAGLPAPMMSVYTDMSDTEGLLRSCRQGRRVGFVGRTAVHPRQLATIVEGFRPEPEEIEAANRLLAEVVDARSAGSAVITLSDGRMADQALIGSAERILALHQRTSGQR